MITPVHAEDRAELLLASPGLARGSRGPAELSGWLARDGSGSLSGAIVDLEGRAADGAAGTWFADSARTLDDLYAVAAQAWVGQGLLTHRVVVGRGDPLGTSLLDLGFGHQQAYAAATTGAVSAALGHRAPSSVEVRTVDRCDLPALGRLVPLVSQHQAGSPVFAPRTQEFLAQLPSSVEELVDDADLRAWVAWDGAEPIGFVLVEHDGDETEVVLAGTVPARRGRGVGVALVGAVLDAARVRGTTRLTADWRTANRAAARFWPSVGFEVHAHRWCRTIDPTPT